MKRDEIIRNHELQKYTLIEDDGKRLVFRKKFSVGIFILWLILTGIGAAGYVVYHFCKPKKYVSYK
jgi:hypothetical protein